MTDRTSIIPSWTWGSSTRLVSVDNTMSASQQLAAVTLPEPAVCSLYFQISIVVPSTDSFAAIGAFTINLLQGIGRVTVPRQISFDSQPSVYAPIEFTMPFVPLHALQVNVQQICHDIVSSPIETEIYLVLSPITRIASKEAKDAMTFGMALPGEADSLDDDMVAELEAESPTVASIMANEARARGQQQPEAEGLEGEDEEAPEVLSADQAVVQDIVAALTERLGRRPSRTEAESAVRRFQSRIMRRSLR